MNPVSPAVFYLILSQKNYQKKNWMKKMKIKDLELGKWQNGELVAIAVQVSEPKSYTTKNGASGVRYSVVLRDETGEISHTFFNPDFIPQIGGVYKFRGIKVGEYAGKPQLEVKRREWGGSVEYLGQGQIPQSQPQFQTQFQPVPDPARELFGLPNSSNPVIQSNPVISSPSPIPFQTKSISVQPQPSFMSNDEPIDESREINFDAYSALSIDINANTRAIQDLVKSVQDQTRIIELGLGAIVQEINHDGIDIISKFEQVWDRLLRNNNDPVEIMGHLAEECKKSEGLFTPVQCLMLVATDIYKIDIRDIIGD